MKTWQEKGKDQETIDPMQLFLPLEKNDKSNVLIFPTYPMLLKDLLLDSGGGIVKLAVKLASPSCHLGPTRIPIEN